MLLTEQRMMNFCSALPIPYTLKHPFVREVFRLYKKSGPEWLTNYLKSIYTDFVRYKGGKEPVGLWYKKTKDGKPSLASGIFRYSLKGKKQNFASIQLLRIYTLFQASSPTEKQMKKFLDGVTSPDLPLPSDLRVQVSNIARKVLPHLTLKESPPYLFYRPSPSRRVPHFDGKTYPEDQYWSSQWLTLTEGYIGNMMMHRYKETFHQVLGFSSLHRLYVGSKERTVDAVGKIGLIQEPGYKLRAVANPNRVYQVALKPLGDALLDVVSQLPWDCTFNQGKAIPSIQCRLNAGLDVHCVDLSGATDYFPLSLQIDVLKSFITDPFNQIGLFQDLSRSDWYLGDGKMIRWTKGQPLGLYPSFASFTLTHGLLLLALNEGRHDDEFFVLGDDVVILNPDLYTKYRSTLSLMGCPVSEAKTIVSRDMAEFAGKLIFRESVVSQLKWRRVSDDNFVDLVRNLGPRSLRILRPRQRKVVKAIWDIPDFVGGLGFNPNGLPLSVRYEKYLTLFGEDIGTYLMSYDKSMTDYFYNQKLINGISPTPSFEGWENKPDLDQRSLSLVLKYLPTVAKWVDILGTNLYLVSPEKGVLPIDGDIKARTSLLEVLERKLSS